MSVTWPELTPEQQGQRREEIHRVLLHEGRSTQSGLMRRLAIDYAIVGEALSAMLQTGAVTMVTENGTKVYMAVPRKTVA